MITVRELLDGETALAFEAMVQLRPDLGGPDKFVARVDDLQRDEGYRLIGSFEEDSSVAAGVAGFRTGNSLAWGHYLYVDDLVTAEQARQRGHAAALMDWLVHEAQRLGCDQFHLDSATHRHDAHRFYLNQSLSITGFHFVRRLDRPNGA